MGTFEKIFGFFLKQDLTRDQEEHILSEKIQRLEQTAHEKKLELERLDKDYILVASLDSLSPVKGIYFIDYLMRPAMAFCDDDGFPIVLSAKCTHLGCTVGNIVDDKGDILCPCHMSRFSIKTGAPVPGSPAKAPLPFLGWAIIDKNKNILLTQDPHGKRQGITDMDKLSGSSLYVLKKYSEEA
ncbi:MAG: Rieske (2Fe-2S) protein [Candidatus Omnitrophica bacterium]|nr:Rieske (2Fe-2S) protein [Candidatus Omnitrophota bacterium]MDE2221606.1 Rieske (2Fe-2S) protein [Candidatus Omnitrophota bacterium]